MSGVAGVALIGGAQTGPMELRNAVRFMMASMFSLVTRHAVGLNPFHSVRGVQHQVLDGKTPEISLPQARRLFAAIMTTPSRV